MSEHTVTTVIVPGAVSKEQHTMTPWTIRYSAGPIIGGGYGAVVRSMPEDTLHAYCIAHFSTWSVERGISLYHGTRKFTAPVFVPASI